MVKILKYIFAAIMLLTTGSSMAYTHIMRSVFIDFSDFVEIKNNLYVSSQLHKADQNEISSLIKKATTRIETYFGPVEADPVIIVVANQNEAADYGLHDTPGALLYAPWQSYLILDYQKKSLDVTAHELVHAEIVHRLGYFKRSEQIPTWFDEGVALQVDYRPQYAIETLKKSDEELEKVTLLDTPKKFWSTDKKRNIANYQAAKVVVNKYFQHIDPENLYLILSRIKDGEEFGEVIQNIN